MKATKNPSLQQFELFLLVAEKASFTAAANYLGMSKAAISQAVRALEAELGVPLLVRSTRSIQLTDEGKLLATQCKRLKYELDTARDLVSAFHQKPKGKLKVSANPHLAENYLLPALKLYLEKFPDVGVEVLVEERMPHMKEEQIDLVVGVNWPVADDIIARKIGSTRYLFCASPAYLKKYGHPKSLKDLEQHQYIPHLGRNAKTPVVSLKKSVDLNIIPQIGINNAHFMKSCALAGLGIVELHAYMVDQEIKTGQLVEVLPGLLKTEEALFIYYQKDRFVQPKIRQLVNLILKFSPSNDFSS